MSKTIIKNHKDISFNVTPYDCVAESRIQNNGVMTKSNIKIPKGTNYKISGINQKNGYSFCVAFNLPNRIKYSSTMCFNSKEDALKAGWNV
jgi:hypothetical protein